jgi:hypothetical protein
VLLCNPNNPTADRHPHAIAVDAAKQLKKRGGWLIVDEAFIDATPEDSLTPLAGTTEAPNLIVCARSASSSAWPAPASAFLFAAPDILTKLAEIMGPWAVAGPSRRSRKARPARPRLANGTAPPPACRQPAPARLAGAARRGQIHRTIRRIDHAALGRIARIPRPTQGILTRRFEQQPLLRFGLPGNETGWQRLTALGTGNPHEIPHFFALTATFALLARQPGRTRLQGRQRPEVRLKAPAKRIVTLAPHATESLYAAGAGDRLVGTVEYSDYPPEAKKVPRVGGYSRVDLEAVAALKPDLVIAWESGNNMAQVDKLKALGLAVYVFQPNRWKTLPGS